MISVDRSLLMTLPERLAGALTANELDVVTRPPDGAGIERFIGRSYVCDAAAR